MFVHVHETISMHGSLSLWIIYSNLQISFSMDIIDSETSMGMTAISLKSLVGGDLSHLALGFSRYAISSFSFTGPLLPLFFFIGWTDWPFCFYKCKHDHCMVSGLTNWYFLKFPVLISEFTDLCLQFWSISRCLCSNCSLLFGWCVHTATMLSEPYWCL